MKKSVNEEQLMNFLYKKRKELISECAIHAALYGDMQFENLTISTIVEKFHEMGELQGRIQGRIEMITEILNYFELINEE